MTMKKLALAAVVASTFAGVWAQAEEAKPDNQVAYNLGVASDYRYRGISQTRLEPALQGGIDYTNNPTGFYVGTWASTIKWIKDFDGDANVEIDIYAGKRGNFTDDISYDVGVLTYNYPSNKLHPSADTTEVYGQLGYGPVYAKYSYSTSNLFGFADSKGSTYLDVGGNFPLSDKLTLNLHAGQQKISKNSFYDYTDYKVGVSYDFGFAVGAIAVIGTDEKDHAYDSPKTGDDLGKAGAVVTLTKTF